MICNGNLHQFLSKFYLLVGLMSTLTTRERETEEEEDETETEKDIGIGNTTEIDSEIEMAKGIYVQIHGVQQLILTPHYGTHHIPILHQMVHRDLFHRTVTSMRIGRACLGQTMADIRTIRALLLMIWSIRDAKLVLIPVLVSHINHRMDHLGMILMEDTPVTMVRD